MEKGTRSVENMFAEDFTREETVNVDVCVSLHRKRKELKVARRRKRRKI